MNQSKSKTAILLINMGGPSNLTKVRRFMFNLFNDPHIMSAPQPLRAFVAWMITAARTPTIKEHYHEIGGGSPLMKWTKLQGDETSRRLSGLHPGIISVEAYSYISPRVEEAIANLLSEAVQKIIAVPLYPHYSIATFGSILSDLEKAREKFNLGDRLKIVGPYYKHPLYIKASVEMIQQALTQIDSSQPFHLLFTAHSLPQSFILKGDPYRLQVEKTVSLILKELPIERWSLSFQSKIGPVEWMKPSTIESIKDLGRRGVRQVIVTPVGFVCDHIETLHELDIELRDIAHQAGIDRFVRAPVFNDNKTFIELLASCVEEYLK